MIDEKSEAWLSLTKHVDEAIKSKSKLLECAGTDQAETEFLRGQIYALRKVLELPNVEMIPKLETETYF